MRYCGGSVIGKCLRFDALGFIDVSKIQTEERVDPARVVCVGTLEVVLVLRMETRFWRRVGSTARCMQWVHVGEEKGCEVQVTYGTGALQ